MRCRKCGSEKAVKNGIYNNKQRYKCKECGFQYTKEEPNGISPEKRAHALMLYVLGHSMNSIAKMYDVYPSTVQYWVRNFAIKISSKTRDEDIFARPIEKSLKNKSANSNYKRHIVALPISSSTGNVAEEIVQFSQNQ